MSLNYRELKRRYELDGADRTVDHLSEALRERHLGGRGIFAPRSGRGAGARRSTMATDARSALKRKCERAGSIRWRRCDRLSERHGASGVLQNPRCLHARGVRRIEAGADHSDSARRGKDPWRGQGCRQHRRGRSRHAVSESRLRRGLHRDADHRQAGFHRARDQGGDLLRPHASGTQPRRRRSAKS